MKKTIHPKIEEYLATYVHEKSMDKGLSMYKNNYATLKSIHRSNNGKAVFKVRSDSGYGTYTVEITHFMGNASIKATCSCLYDWGGACKHIVAAILELDESFLEEPDVVYSMLDSNILLPDLSDEYLSYQTITAHWKLRNALPPVTILSALDGKAECSVKFGKETYTLRFIRQANGLVHSSCSCAQEMPNPICLHKLASLLALRAQFGINAFEAMRDWTKEKNEMLAEYGFTTNDDLSEKFEFKINKHLQLEMKVLDKSLRSATALKNWWSNIASSIRPDNEVLSVPKLSEVVSENHTVFLFAFATLADNNLPDASITPLTARYDPVKDKLSHIGRLENLYGGYDTNIPPVTIEQSRMLNIIKTSFQYSRITTAIKSAGLPLPRWTYNYNQSDLSQESLQAAQTYIGKVWEQLFPLLKDQITVISASAQHHVNSMTRVHVHTHPAHLQLELRTTGEQTHLQCHIKTEDTLVPFTNIKRLGWWLLQVGNTIYRFANWKDAALSQQFGNTGTIAIHSNQLERFISDFVLPLTQHFSVDFNIEKPINYQVLSFQAGRIYLKEDEENLIFTPVFTYQNTETENGEDAWEFTADGRNNRVSYTEGNITVWERDPEPEKHLLKTIENLHPDFQLQAGQPSFYLPFAEVLKNNWLHQFFEETGKQNIAVFGFAQLKKFKYNPNRPVFKIKASSGIDWFDMQMEISFGDQFVSLNDVKKALFKKQNYIQLADGTIGMLPEEWLEKYVALFKFGQIKGDSVQVSKLHFSIIDDLYDQIDNEKVQQEIQEKKWKLLQFKEIKSVELPKTSQANLRDYQIEGFKWLQFLEEFRWGGCLADDMGLGKTLQVLTFLQSQKVAKPDAINLVVVPTTLIFNWQAEVQKFAPEMRVFVHRGVGRNKDTTVFKDFDIILTTYGTLRSDIGFLKDVFFNYVVLDESQAIKNPDAQVSKSVKLLQAQNRLVMTGTPVENNTFDLYSQMDFVNPGLLGSQEFFRSEFANPIDKYRDENAARSLRKIIYPFILKRSKDEVAKDLPDKSEMTLFCEMGKKQRKVYDTYREMYRQKIADKMALEGKEKSAFLILEGLLKLRQICDSPALLSDDADYGEESAKLDEIIRELEENAGDHKILIFSQFLKMLDLIKQHLEKSGIPYEYLDGSTLDRAQRVKRFQESENCRVFLMSLKAGGVGLNLTEADYVYLIDPWWNPAVEQQAIDRTHRIGQTKKVFAYKMICKNTIEEKILLLQEKKKDIAKELISTEKGFIKKLTKEDVIGLFS